MGFSEPSSVYVSSDGHNYNLSCNRNGYVLKSDGPVSRFVEAGASSRIHNLEREVLFLGKDCDAFHKVFGGGKWWVLGRVSIEDVWLPKNRVAMYQTSVI